jgi:hypothetical protein
LGVKTEKIEVEKITIDEGWLLSILVVFQPKCRPTIAFSPTAQAAGWRKAWL